MVRCTIPEPTMKKTLITAVVSMVLAFFSVPTFAKRYVVNGHVASTAEVQYLVSRGFQPGVWVVPGSPSRQPTPASARSRRPTVMQRRAGTSSTCGFATDPDPRGEDLW